MTTLTLRDLDLHDLHAETAHQVMFDRGFVAIGEGHFATAYIREDLPDLVVRVSACMDGWVAYGIGAMNGRGPVSPHAPVVFDMATLEFDGYVALTERLYEPTSRLQEALVIGAGRLGYQPSDRSYPDIPTLPDLRQFVLDTVRYLNAATHQALMRQDGEGCTFHGRSHIDPSTGNFLFRKDGTLVVNDPCGDVMPSSFRTILEEEVRFKMERSTPGLSL